MGGVMPGQGPFTAWHTTPMLITVAHSLVAPANANQMNGRGKEKQNKKQKEKQASNSQLS